MKFCFTAIFFLMFFSVAAQDARLNGILADLNKNDEQQSHRMGKIVLELSQLDTATQQALMVQLGQKIKQQTNEFGRLRFIMLQAFLYNNVVGAVKKPELLQTVEQDFESVKNLDNEQFLCDYYYLYAGLLGLSNKTEQALFYNMKSIKMVDQLGPEKFFGTEHRYNLIGELLYHTREYEKSIEYSKKAFYNSPDTAKYKWKAITLNTIGLAYKQLGIYDSAIVYFDRSKQKAILNDFQQWVTIPDANKAQIYFYQKKYDEARSLFAADYESSIANTDWGNAANNLQWMAKIDLAEYKTGIAKGKLAKAMEMLKKFPSGSYLANTYETLAALYKQTNNSTEAERYISLYNHIHDSVERRMAMSRSEIVQLRLNDERNLNEIKMLEKERQAEKIKRNAFIAFAFLVAVIAFLLYHHRRAKHKQQQQLKETELAAARGKMQLFIKTIAEKSEMIEQLQAQAETAKAAPAFQEHLESLRQKTILTENDWTDFKTTFEKLYPSFFERVKKINTNITPAELRFAALVRLDMNNREAGSILGISTDSARKSRQRLRQRLQLAETDNLEELLLNI